MSIILIRLAILALVIGGIGLYVTGRQRKAAPCPSCGAAVAADAVSCPRCGRRFGPNLGRIGLLLAVVVMLVLVAGLLLTER